MSNILSPGEHLVWAPDEAEAIGIYLRDKVLGPPERTRSFTVEQLQRMHIVGVYMRRRRR